MTILVQQQLRERASRATGSNSGRIMDQKQMDELVALGIQQDKDEIIRLKAENETLLGALQETNHCLVTCLTGGEVSATRAGKAIEAAAIAIEQAMTKEQQP